MQYAQGFKSFIRILVSITIKGCCRRSPSQNEMEFDEEVVKAYWIEFEANMTMLYFDQWYFSFSFDDFKKELIENLKSSLNTEQTLQAKQFLVQLFVDTLVFLPQPQQPPYTLRASEEKLIDSYIAQLERFFLSLRSQSMYLDSVNNTGKTYLHTIALKFGQGIFRAERSMERRPGVMIFEFLRRLYEQTWLWQEQEEEEEVFIIESSDSDTSSNPYVMEKPAGYSDTWWANSFGCEDCAKIAAKGARCKACQERILKKVKKSKKSTESE